MKKTFAVFLGLALAVMCQLALAAAAVVSGLTGTAQIIPDTGATRALRNGDSVNERDTITTAENSGLVLRFEDGQIAAIGASSRMTVSAYSFDVKEPAKGNVLLSLLTGSMRAITGLIGKASPQKVAFRAGTATIGIRGSDISFAANGGNVVVTVADGAIAFTFQGQTVTIPAGQAALTQDGKVSTGTVAAIKAAVASNTALSGALNSVNTSTIENAVKDAVKAADDKAKADKAAADKAKADKAAADKADADKAAADKAAADKAAADKAAADKAAADKAAADSAAAAAAAAAALLNTQPVNNQPGCGANCSSPN